MLKIELGSKAKDRITGFQGIAISHCKHLYGCTTYQLQSEELGDDGKPLSVWFEEERLTEIKAASPGLGFPNSMSRSAKGEGASGA